MPTGQNAGQVQQATLCLVNQLRSEHGLPALRPDGDLGQAAAQHNADMLANDYFDHVGPAGDTPLDRVRASGYLDGWSAWVVGENLAWGTFFRASPAAIVAAWEASPEHLQNILDPGFADTAIGVAPAVPQAVAGGQPGAIYTEEFGGRG